MAIILTHIKRRPGASQWGLDTFTESWKANEAADVVLNDGSVPQRGDAHPDYANMFVTDRYCTEAGENASALDVIYMGYMVALPPQKPSSSGQVASSTTNTDEDIFPATVTNPATVTFYAVTSTLSFISNDPDDASEPTDPPEVDSLITWDLGFGVQPGLSIPGIETYLLTKAFVQAITEAPPDVEPLVSGQFYQITKKKTRTLLPYGPPS